MALMQNFIKAALFTLVLAVAAPVAAQDFDVGLEAYNRGDFAAALREFQPLAEQGYVRESGRPGLPAGARWRSRRHADRHQALADSLFKGSLSVVVVSLAEDRSVILPKADRLLLIMAE